MTDEPAAEPLADARARTDGAGRIIIGPTLRSRYVPGALIGLPLVSLILAPLSAAGIQEWWGSRIPGGLPAQLLIGWVLVWMLLALWALVPMLLTHRIALLDLTAGTVTSRRGLRSGPTESLADLVYAVGYAERGYSALLGFGAPSDPQESSARQWEVPSIGWDDASFDGLRELQHAAGLETAPSRSVLAARARQLRKAQAHRELAERFGMPWLPEYEEDPAAFQRDVDHARRVLGGKEPEG